jgi:hypothetical protein
MQAVEEAVKSVQDSAKKISGKKDFTRVAAIIMQMTVMLAS